MPLRTVANKSDENMETIKTLLNLCPVPMVIVNDLNKALLEVDTLRGILPLCSFCNKIRDDKGYWEKVDIYIRKHSRADISHSICPECAKKNFPKFYKK
jgi:hypothetical protein